MHKINKQLAKVILLVFVAMNIFLQQGLFIFASTDRAFTNDRNSQKAIEAKEVHLTSAPSVKVDPGMRKPEKPHKGRAEKEIIVKYGKVKDSEKSSKLADVKKKLNMKKLNRKPSLSKGFEVIEIDESDNIDEALKEIRNTSGVLYAQPNYQVEILSLPADEYFNLQWGLLNLGQQAEGKTGKAGADINVIDAWKTTKGSDSVVVGIIDTGLDISHADLKDNIFVNTGEIPGNGIDDDLNGYVDDVSGWDFVENDNDVKDDSEHATMIAGIIAAKENDSGIVGVAPGVKVLPLRVFDGRYAYTSDILDAIKYAKDLGVDILNCSWGSSTYNQALRDAMEESDLCFVCAAGNDGTEEAVYPAGFRLKNVISVGAAGNNGERAEFSNYGDFLDVSAPGVNIFSTLPDNSYDYGSGTSYAAAFVSGIAALLKSSRGDLTGKDIVLTIKANTKKSPSSSGLVDAAKTLANIKIYDEADNSDQSVMEEVYGMPSVSEDVYGTFETLATAKLEDFLVEQIHYGQKGVSPATGNFSRSYVDAQINAPGLDFVISRTYNSKDDKDCIHFGRGWRFGYEGFVERSNFGKRVVVTLPDGSRHTFMEYNNTYVQDLSCGTRSNLVYDGTYKLTVKDQTVYEFGVSGEGKTYLTAITDRYGNKTVVNVGKKGKIQGITLQNAKGGTIRSFSVEYGTNEFISKITETTDADSTRVLVQYGYNGKNLTTVTDAMNNTVYTYEYSNGVLSSVKDAYSKVIEEITYKYYEEYKNYKVETHKVYATDTEYNIYNYDYDPLNRITTITDSEGRTVTKWFDKNLFTIKSRDTEGKETEVEYNTYEGRMNFNLLSNPGHAKSDYAEAVYNGRIYHFGGMISTYYRTTGYYLSTDQCEYFDTKTNSWKITASIPKGSDQTNIKENGRTGAAAAVLGSDIYVAGGSSFHGDTEPMIDKRLKSVFKYNPSGDSWSTAPAMNNARADFALVELDGYLYAIGGNGAPTSVEKYDPVQKKWTEVNSTLYSCMSYFSNGYSNFAAVLDGKIYAIDQKFNLEVYDPSTGKWSILSGNAPAGGLVVNKGILYCMNPASGLCAKYDFDDNEWKLINTLMSIDGNSFSVVDCQGRIYVIESNPGLFNQMANWVYEVKMDDTFEYNRYGEEKKVTDRDGNVYEYERDGRGNIIKIINPDFTTREYVYDSKDNLISERDEEGNYTFYIYDSAGVYLKKIVKPVTRETTKYIEGENDIKFAVTSFEYYAPEDCHYLCGMLWRETDPEGYRTTYTYDSKGNVIKVDKTKIGTGSHIITTYQYNSFGWKTAETTQRGFRTEYDYDNNGRLVKVKLHGGETSRIVYDKMGRVIQEIPASLYSAEDDGLSKTPRTFEYAKDHGIRTSYYINGLVKSKTDAQNNTTTYNYDKYGNLIEEANPDGTVYRYYYDVMNRLVKLCFKESTTVPDSSAILLEKYDYATMDDGFTQKTTTKYLDENQTAITVQTYDKRKRLVKQLDPDNTSTTTTYYGNGNIKTQTDKNGSKTYYYYNSCGWLTEVWTPVDYTGNGVTYSYSQIEYYKNGMVAFEKKSVGHTYLNIIPSTFITKEYRYHVNGKVQEERVNDRTIAKYRYDADGFLSMEMKYTSDTTFIKTEYENNYFGKPEKKILYARKGDIYVNDYTDDTEIKIITCYKYNKNGDLAEIASPGQKVTTYRYDNNNRLTVTAYTDAYVNDQGIEKTGEIITSKTYTWDGKVKTETDANGNVTEYIYNKRGFLEKIKNTVTVNGVSTDIYTAYYYDRAGRKIAEVSPQNYKEGYALSQMNRTEYIYDTMGRVKAIKQVYYDTVQGKWIEYISKAYKYDAQGNVVKELDALGYEAGSGTTIVQKIETGYGTEYTYTLANQVKTITDSVSKERFLPFSVMYLYDGLGRKTSEINAKGAYTNYYYDAFDNIEYIKVKENSNAAEKTIKHNKYDYTGNLISTADGEGYEITHQYNALGKVRKTVYPADDGIRENTVEYQYDADGNLIRQADTFGTEDIFTYNKAGKQLSHTRQPLSGTDSEKIKTSAQYDQNGNVRLRVDGNGNKTTYTYDELNRLITESITVTGVNQTTTNSYDKNGNLIATTDWRGNTYEYAYDPLNRLVKKTDPYKVVIERLEYNNNNLQVKSYDALNRMIEYRYDRNNRLVETIDPMNHITRTGYDDAGNVNVKIDGRGNTTTYRYDSFNRLESVTNNLLETTKYTYDINGNIETRTDPNGKKTEYRYVAGDLLRELKDTAGQQESYTYHGNRLLDIERVNGKYTTYKYDSHLRLRLKRTGSSTITYTYDKNGNQLTITDSTGTTSRTYDELNRVLTKTVPDIGTVSYTYDLTSGVEAGFIAERAKDPKNNITTKVYDRAGRLKMVKDGDISSETTTIYNYYDNGSLKSVQYPGGAKEEYTYNDDNLLTNLKNYKRVNGTDVLIDSYTYIYDAAHNQTAKTEVINGKEKGTTTFTYDVLNRLESIKEPSGKTTSYKYDNMGNRQTETVTDYSMSTATVTTYNYNAKNQLTSVKTVNGNQTLSEETYTYDSYGNMIAKTGSSGTTVNEYDGFNQLVKTVTGNKESTYKYNGEGLRVEKTTGGATTRYLYEYDKIVLETDGSGVQTARNIYGINLVSRKAGTQTLYYLYNGHADVTALIDSAGNIVVSYYYDPFGNILESTGTVNNPIRYAGYQYDEESGYYYLNARMYDPRIARFLQMDTYKGDVRDPLSLNLYTYCYNEPIMYWDPTGNTVWRLRTLVEKAGGTIEFNEKETSATVTVNNITKTYTTDELVLFNGSFIIDDRLFKLDFGYRLNFFNIFKPSLKLNEEDNDIRDLNLFEFSVDDLENTEIYKVLPRAFQKNAKDFVKEYGLVGYIFTMSKAKDLYNLFESRGKLTDRQAYLNGLSPEGLSIMELEYHLNKNGTSVVEQDLRMQNERWAQLEAFMYINIMQAAANVAKMPNVPETEDFRGFNFGNKEMPKTNPVGGGCFTAGTFISTENGQRPIEEVEIGDYVWSENPETGEKGLKKVVNTFIHDKDTLIYVYTGDTMIETTEEHPFWVEDKGWVFAGELNEGDVLRLKSGENVKIEKLERVDLEEPVKVYNFEVQDWHTYYVSNINVLVHNKAAYNNNVRIYESIKKHNPKSGWGSPDPFYNDANAGQKALDTAYSSSKTKQLYNYVDGKLVKFQPDSSSGKWHAYKVINPAKEVPADVLRQMKYDGLITNVEYNKFINNN